MQRPTSVTVIGWISIVLGGLMILGAGMGLVGFEFMRQAMRGAGGWPLPPEGAPWPTRLLWGRFGHFEVLAVLEVVVAGLMLAAGTHFLRLRAWARRVLEVCYWLGLAYVVGFGVFWMVSWVSLTAAVPEPDAGGPPFPAWMLPVFGMVIGAVNILLFGGACTVMIWFLRGTTIREAVRRPAP